MLGIPKVKAPRSQTLGTGIRGCKNFLVGSSLKISLTNQDTEVLVAENGRVFISRCLVGAV